MNLFWAVSQSKAPALPSENTTLMMMAFSYLKINSDVFDSVSRKFTSAIALGWKCRLWCTIPQRFISHIKHWELVCRATSKASSKILWYTSYKKVHRSQWCHCVAACSVGIGMCATSWEIFQMLILHWINEIDFFMSMPTILPIWVQKIEKPKAQNDTHIL